MPNVYDCFPAYNEFDLVDLRMATLRDVASMHIGVVATLTHAGNDNVHISRWVNDARQHLTLYLHEERDRRDGIPATRRREMGQRNAIVQALRSLPAYEQPLPNDIILISDADEIPNPAIVAQLREQGMPEGLVVIFRQRLCYYDLNTTQGYLWQGTRAVRWDDLQALSPHVVRYGLGARDDHYPKYGLAMPGGWHLSYFGGAERVREKMVNFLHQELVNEDTQDAEKIAERIAAAQDIYGRSESEWTVERTTDVPSPVLEYPAQWRHLWRPGYEPEGE